MRSEHGTYARYSGRPGCRCKACKTAKANYVAAARDRGLSDDDPRHGTRNGYDNFGCRCKACCYARSIAYRDYWQRVKAS